ncbi:putative ABC transport system permease protein [Kribbella voronezhensis]|uniref:Putative ABC transport system permease protein n=1 Tax=Kribbella voronezhensis TaxID=2512212 RepID=A0A4R7T094_9ACTN|nr:FtsX-like permease family protein [Kribbella voronezhensis]TDU84247.1 putative ABC transport system permease protein [Kribbella voronezhensis]
MRATTRKTLRDLRRQRAQVIAVGITVMLGVALFIASAGAFRNLSDSYRFTYDRLHFADVSATGGNPESIAAAARDAGAAAVTTRTQTDPPLMIDGTKLVGRVVGLPAGHQPAVDAVDVSAGQYLSADDPDGVLVERHAADTFGLTVGDSVQVFTGHGWHRVTIRGIARSAEYIWPARSRQDVLGDPHAFAVLFADEQAVRQWTGGGPNQVLAELDPTHADVAATSASLRRAGATDVVAQVYQASNATLREDLNGFSELSIAFPLLFLTAAAVAAYVLLARRVLAERSIIGTLMAAGARRGRLVRHYLQQGLLVGLFGGLAGAAVGVVATGAITRAYTGALGIPDTVTAWHPGLVLIGLAFGAAVGLSGAAAPALTAARTVPAEAMRNQTGARPPGAWSRLVARMRWLPVSARMALRDVFRGPRRTLATMLGAVLALVLVLASIGMLTSVSTALDKQYGQIERQDATVVTATGTADSGLHEVRGIAAVERSRTGQVVGAFGNKTYATQLQAFPVGTAMHRFRSTSGQWLPLPDDGVLAGAAVADKLGIAVGDQLTLSAPGGHTVSARLMGLLDEPVGTSLYSADRLAAQVLPASTVNTYLVRFDDGVDRDTMRQNVSRLPGVVAYADAHAVTAAINQYLGLFWAFIAIMVLLGAILAGAVIYVTMAVNVVERTNELATLRAAGVPLRRTAGTLATENLAATGLGLPFGLVAGVVAAHAFLDTFSSDLFRFDLVLSWWALPAAALGVLIAAALSQWPAVRAVRRLDIARVVRERAQ